MTPIELKSFAVFQDLLDEDLEMLAPLLEEQQLTPGRRILREGEDADGMVLVWEGSVRLETQSGDVETLEAPVAFGTAALVAVGARVGTVVTETPCTILTLTRTAFHRFADDSPRGAVRVLERLVVELAGLLRQSLDHV